MGSPSNDGKGFHARPLPAKEELTVCFAHVAYRLSERFALRNTGINCFEVRNVDDLKARGKTLVIVGMGRIGSRLATLAKAFDMYVIASKRDPSKGAGAADKVVGEEGLHGALAEADFVVLTCRLTPKTEHLIDASALASMKPSACLVNVARGKVVDESALVEALKQGRIAGAALDCVWEEPLPAGSALWTVPNVLITPHTAGETRKYEDNVLDLLMENLGRMWRRETTLKNQFA